MRTVDVLNEEDPEQPFKRTSPIERDIRRSTVLTEGGVFWKLFVLIVVMWVGTSLAAFYQLKAAPIIGMLAFLMSGVSFLLFVSLIAAYLYEKIKLKDLKNQLNHEGEKCNE